MEFGEQLEWIDEDPLAELAQIRTEILASGRELFDLSMLNPDMAPPRLMLDRLVEASMKADNHRYAVSRGVRKLRDAFAAKYCNRFGASLDPEREICATMGTKEAIVDCLRFAQSSGLEVLVGKPAYPALYFSFAPRRN